MAMAVVRCSVLSAVLCWIVLLSVTTVGAVEKRARKSAGQRLHMFAFARKRLGLGEHDHIAFESVEQPRFATVTSKGKAQQGTEALSKLQVMTENGLQEAETVSERENGVWLKAPWWWTHSALAKPPPDTEIKSVAVDSDFREENTAERETMGYSINRPPRKVDRTPKVWHPHQGLAYAPEQHKTGS